MMRRMTMFAWFAVGLIAWISAEDLRAQDNALVDLAAVVDVEKSLAKPGAVAAPITGGNTIRDL